MRGLTGYIFLLSLLSGSQLISATVMGYSPDILALEEKLYAKEGPVASVEETFMNLKLLNEKLSPKSGIPEVAKKRAPIQALLVASLTNHERCTGVVTNGFTSLVDYYNQQGYVNIIAYVKDCRRKHLQFCKPRFADMLAKAILGLGKDVVRGMNKLRSDIANAVPDMKLQQMHLFVPRRNLKAGVTKFVTELNGGNLESAAFRREGGKDRFARCFSRLVGTICSIVQSELQDVMDFYKPLILYKEAEVKEYEMKWYTNYQVCNNIMLNLDAVIDELYTEIVPSAPKLTGSVLSRFWRP